MMSAIPNILSITRIILIPIYLYFFINANYLTAGILFCISAITDFFDGYIARKYDAVTDLGRILDPFADKLTVISILIALLISEIIPRIIPIILLARELFIFIGSIVAYLLGFDFIHPSKLGKFSIFLLYSNCITVSWYPDICQISVLYSSPLECFFWIELCLHHD